MWELKQDAPGKAPSKRPKEEAKHAGRHDCADDAALHQNQPIAVQRYNLLRNNNGPNLIRRIEPQVYRKRAKPSSNPWMRLPYFEGDVGKHASNRQETLVQEIPCLVDGYLVKQDLNGL